MRQRKIWIFLMISLLCIVLYCERKHGSGRELADFSHKELTPPPAWAQQGILYQIFPRVFSNEGTFQGIKMQLPYIKNLGIDVIWLMPIFPIGEKGKKGTIGSPYAVKDFQKINPDYGTAQDFHELVNEIHLLGMKIILDFIPNHGSNDNVLMKEHPDWFMQDKTGKFTREVADWSDVADFNYENPELRNYMIETMIYWIENFDIDGYRCDVAGMVPYDFWEDAIPRLRTVKPDIYLLAEWEDPEILFTGFNSDYSWTEYYLLKDIRKGKRRTAEFLNLVAKKDSLYPRNSLPMRFLENHDEPRSLSEFGVEAIKAYAMVLFTLPGIPLLYAGQESGEFDRPSLFEKSTINWQEMDRSLLNMYQSLIRMRKRYSCFTRGEFICLPVTALSGSPGAFMCEDDRSVAVVICNLRENMVKNLLVNFPAGVRERIMSFHLHHYQDSMDVLNLNEIYFKELSPFSTVIYICKK
jgi:cyclomaltodextrinase